VLQSTHLSALTNSQESTLHAHYCAPRSKRIRSALFRFPSLLTSHVLLHTDQVCCSSVAIARVSRCCHLLTAGGWLRSSSSHSVVSTPSRWASSRFHSLPLIREHNTGRLYRRALCCRGIRVQDLLQLTCLICMHLPCMLELRFDKRVFATPQCGKHALRHVCCLGPIIFIKDSSTSSAS
jgi:hypothetical protein